MSMLKGLFVCLLSSAWPLAAEPLTPQLGRPAPAELVVRWNTDIFPDGEGLPPGQGTAAQGKVVYEQHCQICHGAEGRGGSADELAGAAHGLKDNPPDKTIGTYWPYATTVFDFTRRAMPLDKPGSLSNEQVYAVTAYLLYLNQLVKLDAVIDAKSLPQVMMPNKDGFIDAQAGSK